MGLVFQLGHVDYLILSITKLIPNDFLFTDIGDCCFLVPCSVSVIFHLFVSTETALVNFMIFLCDPHIWTLLLLLIVGLCTFFLLFDCERYDRDVAI